MNTQILDNPFKDRIDFSEKPFHNIKPTSGKSALLPAESTYNLTRKIGYLTKQVVIIPVAKLFFSIKVHDTLKNNNICLSPWNHLPNHFLNTIHKLYRYYTEFRESVFSLTGCLNSPLLKRGLIGPILEESLFRLVIQEILLKRIPKMILSQIAPSKTGIVDSRLAKVLRVIASAAIFSLMHVRHFHCLKGGGIPQFISGLVYGADVELSGHIVGTILAHIGNNSIQILMG